MDIILINTGGVNCYIIQCSTHWILVDTGNNFEALERKIESYGLKLEDLKLVIITHAHSDHVGALKKLQEKSNANILIHKNERNNLEQGYTETYGGTFLLTKILGFISNHFIKSINSFSPVIPDILIDHSFDLNEYGINGRVEWTPGHTEGSISVIVDNDKAIVGDILFNISSKSVLSFFSNDKKQLLTTCQKLLTYRFKTYYVGHGKPLTFEEYNKRFKRLETKLSK